MSIEVFVKGKDVVVDSLNLSDVFGKRHDHVIRDIDHLDCSTEFKSLNFHESSYKTRQGKTARYFDMTKDGFTFLCFGWNGKKAAEFKEGYIKAFNDMYNTLNSSAPTLAELNLAVKQLEEDKKIGSFHGKGMADYRKKKIENEKRVKDAIKSAQLSLGFKF